MDMTASIAPKTDQINNEDFKKTGPITVTINRVTEGPAEQPFNFHMEETPGRAYRPSKSMRRVMVAAWGTNPAAYVGHSLTLYRNAATRFGSEQTGGIEISHLSHIDKALTVPLTAKRGVRKNFTVKPLATAAPTPARDWIAEMDATTDIGALADLYKEMVATPGAGSEALKDAFGTRGAAIKAGETFEGDAA